MRKIVIGFVLAGLVSASGQTRGTAKKAAQVQGLPASAEKVGEGTWKWKDAQGKAWVYHRTAFGYSRTPDLTEKTAGSAAAPEAGLRVVETKNGQVTFEQATPFGKSRWSRDVSDMNGDEKVAFEAHQRSAKAARSAK